MKRLVLVCVLLLPLSGSVQADGLVHFPDANLKAAVERELWISDPTETDMLGLTSLWAGSSAITDLTGLEYAKNLCELNLPHNEITSVAALSTLVNLKTLALNTNEISSIAPLSGLSQLETLNLHDNQISDISAVSGLTALKTLILRINQISSISAVSGLAHLETLVLEHNQVSDISALSGLTRLTYLRLGQNQIRSVSALAGLGQLEYLDLHRNEIQSIGSLSGLGQLQTLILQSNEISDISALSGLTSLRRLDLRNNPLNQEAYDLYLHQILSQNPSLDLKYDEQDGFRVVISSTAGGSVLDPGEGAYAYAKGDFVRLEAEADPGFVFLHWSGNWHSAQNPAFLAVEQDYAIQATFVSSRDTLYVDDDAPSDPGPDDAARSDPHENGTWEHPFDEIQEAIECGAEGSRIVVRAGIYRENIDLLGKRLELTAFDPNDATAPAFPLIDGGNEGTVVSFTRGEDPNCVVMGFVLTQGKGQQAGAIRCYDSSPTIANCLIVGNRTVNQDGAAVRCTDSNASFVNCTLAENYTGTRGAAFHVSDSNVVIVNSIVWDNEGAAILCDGTGAVSIRYSDIEGGWPGLGNLDSDPRFARYGYWVDPDRPDSVLGPHDAGAIWIAGDYHLESRAGRWTPTTHAWRQDDMTSPCIDAGDPLVSVGQEPLPNGDIINMGAYGGSNEASKSP